MRRTRARLLASAVVLAAMSVAYAGVGLVTTDDPARSNPSIPNGSGGRIVFSVRNPVTNSALEIMDIRQSANQLGLPVNGCAGVTVMPLSGAYPVSLMPGQQAQFIATASGFPIRPADTDFICYWEIDIVGQAIIPPDAVTTSFNAVLSPSTPLDVQPARMRFEVTSGFEQQRFVITNYGPGITVNLEIMNDTLNAFSFSGGPCSGHVCNTVSLGSNGMGSGYAITCTPAASPATATFVVTDTGGTTLGSASLECQTISAPMETIFISPNTIAITAMQGMVGSASGTVTTMDTGQLGSAAIMSLDPSMALSYCGATSCSWLPPQDLTVPYELFVECTPGPMQTSGTLVVFEAGGSGSAVANVTCTGDTTGPVLVAMPSALNLGNVQVGSNATAMVHIENTGGTQADNVLLSFGNSHWRASSCTTSGCTILPGPSNGIDVIVTFAPTTHGAKDTALTITSTAPDTAVSVTGTGIGGVMSVTTPAPPSYVLDFGTIPRNQQFSRNIVIENLGNDMFMATPSGATLPYTIDPGPHVVLPNQPKSVAVMCGSASATTTNNPQAVTITSTAYTGSPVSVQLRCKIADTLVQVSPTMFDFGEVRINTQPEPAITVTLTNPPTSGADAQLQAIGLRENKPGLRLVAPATPLSLAPGTNTTATLQLLTGSDTDLASEFLELSVDGTMLAFPITGKVVTPSSRVVPPQLLDLGTACVGTQVSGNVMLINDGTATLNIQPPQMTSSFLASAPPTTVLPPAMSVTAEISPAMSATGMISGVLTWNDDVPNMHVVDVVLDYVASGTALSPRALDFGVVNADAIETMPPDPQHVRLENCDATPTSIKIESLRTKQGPLIAWDIEPRVGYTKQLASREAQAITVSFAPPARGRYEAELTVQTRAGKQVIHLFGDATGRDFDDTSFYACACNGPGAPSRGWPVIAAIVIVIWRRRGSSSAR